MNEVGVTSLIKRLHVEYEGLNIKEDAFCSLRNGNSKESDIRPAIRQDLVDMGSAKHFTFPQVAIRLLCFVLKGLSTAYTIPVGYLFFTRCFNNDKLSSITTEVMKAAEQVGFCVTRSVADNHQTNVALFKGLLGDGALGRAMPHLL